MSVSIITDFTTANAKGAIIQGPLAEILLTTVQAGCRAYPSDVTGTYLEMGSDGLWDGPSVGSFGSIAQLYALPTAYLAFGARASVNGVQYTYGAAGWAWVAVGGGGLLPENNLSDLTSIGDARNNLGVYPDLAKIFKSTAGNVFALWGSSTLSYSTSDSTAKGVYSDSLMFAALAANQSPFSIAYNGAVGGTDSPAIQTKFLAESGSYSYDVAVLQFGGNDFPSGKTSAYVQGYVLPCILAALRLGKKVILIVPYTRNPNPVPHTEYSNYSLWCASMALRFVGRVFVVDLWATISPGVDTPVGYLDGTGVHVNTAGSWACAPAWTIALKTLYGEYSAEIDSLGMGTPLVTPYAPPSGWSVSNVTEAVGQTDSMGRTSRRITCTGVAAAFYYKDITVGISLGDTYRAFADVIVVNGGALPIGCYFRAGDSSVITTCGSGYRVDLAPPANGTRMRLMTTPVVATAAMVASSRLGIAFGGINGAVVDVFSCGVFKV